MSFQGTAIKAPGQRRFQLPKGPRRLSIHGRGPDSRQSAGVTNPPALPKLARTYEAIAATQASVFVPLAA